MWPIYSLLYVAMFYGAIVNVIHMPFDISLITNLMFPIAALPDTPFTFCCAAWRNVLLVGQESGKNRP